MLKDVSGWEHIGYGGKSTLEKEELKSPEQLKYLIKYPRKVKVGVSWEDITEFIAAQIGMFLGLEMMKVEIVTRNGRRGCLLRNFVDESGATIYEEGGVLLASLVDGYNELQESSLKNLPLIDACFEIVSKLDLWELIKLQFIEMLVFDILIGNQDRHPFNWQILYFGTGIKFSPIYDNGASLGFRFEDERLIEMTSNSAQINKYVRNTRVKAGLLERKNVKATDLLTFLQMHYPNELVSIVKKLKCFNVDIYRQFIQSLDLLSDAQKTWLQLIVPYRREKILEWIEEEEQYHE